MFDLAGLRAAVMAEGVVARVVIAGVKGSSPREVGAAMLVWAGGQSGTIGGGALEWQAVQRARLMLAEGGARLDREALGPDLGQCCGGVVSVLTEVYRVQDLPEGPVVARALEGAPLPLAVQRVLAEARGQGVLPRVQVLQGWLIEPVAPPAREVWIWGAGHVGRALVSVLAPLAGMRITWVDFDVERFPPCPEGVRVLPLPEVARAVPLAGPEAAHLIVTYSHALDLQLCDRLLRHGFGFCGLIGSASKWRRFRTRLGALGHGAEAVARITCPIGDPGLGKEPQAIAIGVAAELLRQKSLVQRAICSI
jgi:xanthine dehydrogenase accessory factor